MEELNRKNPLLAMQVGLKVLLNIMNNTKCSVAQSIQYKIQIASKIILFQLNDIYILKVFVFKITRREFITGKLISHERVKYLKIFKISGENRKKSKARKLKLKFYY